MDPLKADSYELFGLGETVLRTHGQEQCGDRPCVIHSPSEHHMRDWPICFRFDKNWLAERTCPHGIGHPDPDSLAYFKSIGISALSIHGCDGCCQKEEK